MKGDRGSHNHPALPMFPVVMRVTFRLFLSALPLIALAPAGGHRAAASVQLSRGDTTPPVVLERITRERWIHGGQDPRFVAPMTHEDFIHVRVRNNSSPDMPRRIEFRLPGLSGTLTLTPRNHIRFTRLDLPAVVYSEWDDSRERVDARRQRLTTLGTALPGLPASRVRDVPFPVPGRVLEPGVTWVDTLSFLEQPGEGLSEQLDGVRHNRVVGDTVLGGRRLPVVRTEAQVRYRSVVPTTDESMDGDLVVERDVRGTVVGSAVVDTARGMRAGGADTTAWAGTAVLKVEDGRAFSSRVRFERVRTWALMDSAVWADSMKLARRRNGFSILVFPDSLQRRLRAGDTALADSLWERWRTTSDAGERQRIGRLLGSIPSGPGDSEAAPDRLRRLSLQAGDTSGWLLSGLNGLQSVRRLDSLLPYLDDLGRMWKLGVLPRWTYLTLAEHVLRSTPILQADSSRWGCAPAACRRLAELRESAYESRMRDVGLVLSFIRDPARWTDRLEARADSGSNLVRQALLLAHGVGATWPAAPRDPIPEPGAGWRAWLSWMGGTVRFEESHRDALLMYRARTGRDAVAELLRAWPPEADSARLVLGTILGQMGALPPPTGETLMEDLLSGVPARIQAAQRSLASRLWRGAAPAPPELAAELLAPLLDSLFSGGEAPWPAVPGLPAIGRSDRTLHRYAVVPSGPVPRLLLARDLPAAVIEQRPPLVQMVDSATWAARSPRRGAVLVQVNPVTVWEDFVSVSWRWTVHENRAEDENPRGYAGGGGVWLMRTPDGWRVVGTSSWIT